MELLAKESFSLNPNQEEAYMALKQSFEDKEAALLQGVTGSGKTHVYVKLIEEALNNGKQVLYLLPEIALTSQIIKRINKYFGEHCIAYHSKFNDRF